VNASKKKRGDEISDVLERALVSSVGVAPEGSPGISKLGADTNRGENPDFGDILFRSLQTLIIPRDGDGLPVVNVLDVDICNQRPRSE
jgi:hypothetical protein